MILECYIRRRKTRVVGPAYIKLIMWVPTYYEGNCVPTPQKICAVGSD